MSLPTYTCANKACGKTATGKGVVISKGKREGRVVTRWPVHRNLAPTGWTCVTPDASPDNAKWYCSAECVDVYQETPR